MKDMDFYVVISRMVSASYMSGLYVSYIHVPIQLISYKWLKLTVIVFIQQDDYYIPLSHLGITLFVDHVLRG